MGQHPPPTDPPLLAVEALDDFVAEIVRQAHAAGVRVPARFFDWTTGEGTRLVERLVERRRLTHSFRAPADDDLVRALRCGVRYWTAPWVVARFPELAPLFPELTLRASGASVSVLIRTGRWRCASGADCAWKLCESAGA